MRNEYDAFGRLIGQENPTKGRSIVIDSQFGPGITRIAQPDGSEAFVRYDSLGRVVETIDALGRVSRLEHGPLGVVKALDALGGVQQFQRDQFGRVVKETKEDGSFILNSYDSKGNLVSRTNELGTVTRNEYDERGNLLSTKTGNAETSYVYDITGSITKSTDAEGGEINYRRNAAGYVLETTLQNGLVTTYQRNLKGQETVQSTVIRDDLGVERVVSIRRSYDANGNLKSLVDSQGSRLEQDFDALGNLETIQDQIGRSVEYDHNGTGLVHGVRFANGSSSRFSYDDRDQVSETTDIFGRVTKFSYNAVGDLVAKILPDETPSTDEDNPRYVYHMTPYAG